jgi:DNA polymerase
MIYFDFETRSEADIKETGAWVYSLHPSTSILCLAFKDTELKLSKLLKPGFETDPSVANYFKQQIEKGTLFESHNAFFERAIWENILVKKFGWEPIPAKQWRCSASVAAYHALPRNLQNAGGILGLSNVKDIEGKYVMMQLARPKSKGGFISEADAPEKFEALYKYCEQDVQAEEALSERLGQLPDRELAIWQLDQKINHRGVHIDREAVETSLKILEEYIQTLQKEVAIISEGQFETVNQRAKVMEWCKQQGENVMLYDKAYIAEILPKVKNPKVKRILEIRQAIGKTSTAKYQAMANSMAPDNRIRDVLFYHGAATGRWTGKLVQFQNLPRGSIKEMDQAIKFIKKAKSYQPIEMIYDRPMDFMSSLIRGMVCAPEGKMLVVADFAAIEARVLGWVAGCEGMLKQFRNGEDLYKDMASKIFKVAVDKVSAEQRQLGKAAILGAGYGMGADKFFQTCKSWGITIDETLAQTAIQAYRRTYLEVPKFWQNTETAAHNAVRSKQPMKVGATTWFMDKGFLKCKLPSGRCLHYYQPRFEMNARGNTELTYWSESHGGSVRTGTYGGKLVENVVQAIARDLMAEAMWRLEKEGFEIVLSIHDEIVAEYPIADSKSTIKTFEKLMSRVPAWAEGCPIEAAGWTGKHYKK